MSETIAAGKGEAQGGMEAEGNSVVFASRIHVLRSLRGSRVRTEVALYLYKIYPEASYPAEIGRNTGIDATNVIGALRGMGRRFDESNSLLGLGLVDIIEGKGVRYYQLSGQGKSVMENLNNQGSM